LVDVRLYNTDGLCLNSAGEVYAWGKGNRGQLGYDRIENESLSAVPVHKAVFDLDLTTQRPVYRNLEKVSHVAAGMLHSAALEEESNHVYTWGKHILPPLLDNPASGALSVNNSNTNNRRYQKASDAHIPVRLRGLPAQLKVLQISCGSHHTSILLEDGSVWAVGIATDSQQPMFDPVCLLAPGVVDGDLPVRYFCAHMDRTTVVTNSGQVFQVHLWEDPANQDVAVFTPAWAHALMADAEDKDAADGGVEQVQSVHRSWLHTLVVTKTVATKNEP
jgi:alpha-tubulin suppressor-like RCC1 family protein